MYRPLAMVAVSALVMADPALAEQQAIGMTPRTVWEGLQSGLRNPVIGLVHLAPVLAVGCLAATQANGAALAFLYALATVFGAAAHIGEATVANASVFAALAAVALGLMVFRKDPLRRDIVFALFAGCGLINGYVLGAPIAAALREPMLGYLAGLAAIHFAIASAMMFGVRTLTSRTALQLLAMRMIGAFTVGAGAAILLQRYAAGT